MEEDIITEGVEDREYGQMEKKKEFYGEVMRTERRLGRK